MPISHRDLLNQAKGLAVPEEAVFRALVGRAYYACYHCCREWERTLPEPGKTRSSTKGVHQQLIERLQRPDKRCSKDQVKRSEWLARQLGTLRALRLRADYRLDERISDEEANAQVSLADAVFKRCDWGVQGGRQD